MSLNRRKMSWAEKGGCKPKPCKLCRNEFKPGSSGDLYCMPCKEDPNGLVAIRRERHRISASVQRNTKREHYRKIKRQWDLSTRFGISNEIYDEMLKSQNGLCAICFTDHPSNKKNVVCFFVDHDHATGKVRGLLCEKCNRGLGLFRDNQGFLARAIDYLEKYK
jgi:Recombination endonuclease VII